jgi:hypothetical protein
LLISCVFSILGLVLSQAQDEISLEIDPPIPRTGILKVAAGISKLITCRANVPNPELIKDMKWYWNNGDEVRHSDGK